MYKKLAIIAILLALVACKETKNDKPIKETRIKVSTIEAVEEKTTTTFRITANSRAENQAELYAETSGTVDLIYYPEGSQVTKGSTILKIQNDATEADHRSALANESFQCAKALRHNELLKKGLVSKQATEEAEKSCISAQSNTKAAKYRLSKLYVSSPVDGIVTQILTDKGEQVSPGKHLATVTNDTVLEVVANIPSAEVASVEVSDAVTVFSGNHRTAGMVTYVSPVADEKTKTFETFIRVSKTKDIKPGMSFAVEFSRQSIAAIEVPLEAISTTADGGYYVYTVKEDSAEKTPVEIQIYQDKVLVTKGLKSGDKVVVKGNAGLVDGIKVKE